MPAVEYSKSFITSVVLGKDVVPRIGLHQMETLRADLINAIKRSIDPKVKICFLEKQSNHRILNIYLYRYLKFKSNSLTLTIRT